MSSIFIDPQIYTGRPASAEGRLDKEMAVYDLLDKLEIPFTRVDHEVAMTIEDCQGVDQLLGIEICKNLVLCNTQKTKFYLLLMPGDKQFKTKDLSKQIGSSRLSFAPAEYMEKLLNVTPGSATVMALMNDLENQVQLIIDEDVTAQEEFGCHPCINTSSLKMKTADVLQKFLPAVHHEAIFVKL
ncbi:prolyl-tRNA synthetase associated domain-containing protein [Anaerosacchariphilus sp. NSJ-68]|uniref:Prolyl-tRNA synthetase associated domain-containing protein n=2 Tax=Lachnospiraceae TaxID=186803 RepID=A0A923LFK7_9FIRM|nr:MULTISPECIES: prolyl-tRNA synthetase associated domain-containing protein [Lachnospiraceae]MBC5661142.1 prolyl-tRNA synthetase associated domain-containing protein [Anaerosacchariphilus hominis]MBC5697624.1 prolyl-tRNA synthetase associated domain-containing protein [Roseburia difficilis]